MFMGMFLLIFTGFLLWDSYLLLLFSFSLPLIFLYFFGGFFDGLIFIDFLSFFLSFLTVWVFIFSFFSVSFCYSTFFLFWAMMVFSFISFTGLNCFSFYFSFELVFIFMFFYLLSWGVSAERFQASFYMFFYTLIFSLPFFFILIKSDFINSSIFFLIPFFYMKSFFWPFLFLVFMVKLPLFGFHSWLPKAHVESPVMGSMILAGVLLKLGGYGVIRFLSMVSLVSFSSIFFSFMFYVSLWGAFFCSFLCLRQMDLKVLIAYSSVVHMSVMCLGIFSFNFMGGFGAIAMMFSHGFISPALFYLMTEVYKFKSSRSILVLKGCILFSPIFTLFWFLFCSLNLSVPPFMSFFSEISIIMSLGLVSAVEWFLVFLCCFLTGVYCVYMYVVLSHGSEGLKAPLSCSLKVFLMGVSHSLVILAFPLIFVF